MACRDHNIVLHGNTCDRLSGLVVRSQIASNGRNPFIVIYRLDDDDPYLFPPAELAEADGLLAVGGDYRFERLLSAYSRGIFPWPFDSRHPITWFSPDPRFVLKADDFRIPKSLKKTLRKNLFEYRVDTAFAEVIHACATVPRPGQDGTWITDELEKGYCELNRRGFAHSFEAWQDGRLVGGFYGVSIGPCFFGESMFARVPDASKCAFATFARRMFDNGVPWIDSQVYTDHIARFGAKEIPRSEYLRLLTTALAALGDREESDFDPTAR